MAKTALLNNEELLFLREAIIDKFRQTNPYAQEFKPNAFLPNYDELKQSMEAALPDMAPSISLKRLRKLFYDTDHERRGPEKVAKPNFGVDFLDTCYLYITDGQSNRYDYLLKHNGNNKTTYKAIRNKVWMLSAIILLSFLFFIGRWLYMQRQPTNYVQEFNFSTPQKLIDSLRSEGWDIKDTDNAFLYKQQKPGYLTLYTLAGDYWVKPNEKPIIKNLFVKKINCGACCEISVKLVGFHAQMPFQQIVLMIFGKKIKPDASHLRYCLTMVDTNYMDSIENRVFDGLYIHLIRNKTGIRLYSQIIEDNTIALMPKDTIYLKIKYVKQHYLFSTKTGFEWNAEKEMYSTSDVDFKPEYVGLASFHGYSDLYGKPLNADTIPAYIDYIKILPCPK